MRIPGLFGSFNKALARIQVPILTLPGNIKKQSIAAAAGAQDFKRLNSGTVSSAATLDIVLTGFTAYRGLKFVLSGFLPVTDDVELWMRFSTDGGATFDSGAGAYSWVISQRNTGGDSSRPSTSDTKIILAGGVTAGQAIGNASNEGINLEVTLLKQISTTLWSRVFAQGAFEDASATSQTSVVAGAVGMRRAAQDTDAVRFLFESGNISAGDWAVYGLT